VTALAEIDELKQTIRYLEITITKSKEEKEKLTSELNTSHKNEEKLEGDNKKNKLRINEIQYENEVLAKKIANFGKTAGNLNEKNKFKASSYMSDLT